MLGATTMRLCSVSVNGTARAIEYNTFTLFSQHPLALRYHMNMHLPHSSWAAVNIQWKCEWCSLIPWLQCVVWKGHSLNRVVILVLFIYLSPRLHPTCFSMGQMGAEPSLKYTDRCSSTVRGAFRPAHICIFHAACPKPTPAAYAKLSTEAEDVWIKALLNITLVLSSLCDDNIQWIHKQYWWVISANF